jgi:TolB-like protein/Flp pilus assembly protein TadD
VANLFTELKRRNVVRVGIAYIVVGWLVLQVGDVLFDMFETPAWVGKTMAGLILLGFPFACLFAWAFELTPEGIKTTAEVDTSDSITHSTGRKLNIVIGAALSVALLIAFGLWQQSKEPAGLEPGTGVTEQAAAPLPVQEEAAVEDASIAVLPFADLSPESDQEYFSDGISEEILNVLVRIKDLSVASRTSSFGFKGQAELGIPIIAEKLKVRHVLEGSVRKAGDTVRITAQLIDAKSDTHLWSETYDRKLTTENIFHVQDEIAAAIVEQLGLLIGDAVAAPAPRETATGNVDAYSAYLKAQGLFHRRSSRNLEEIVALYERATELDPEFAEAWAGLANAYSVMPGWGLGSDEEFLPKARKAADRASALDDRLALPYAIRAVLDAEFNDQIGAMEQLATALERDPDNLQAHYIRGATLLEIGFLAEAESDFRRCLDIDPAYEICRRFLSFALLFQDKGAAAAKHFEIGILRGQESWRETFHGYYAVNGNVSALAYGITALMRDAPWFREPVFRLYTDTTYGVEEFWADVRRGALAAGAEPPAANVSDRTNDSSRFHPSFFWNPYDLSRLRTKQSDATLPEQRKAMMISRGLFEYWKKFGFPPQCRQVGEDDFRCDVAVAAIR